MSFHPKVLPMFDRMVPPNIQMTFYYCLPLLRPITPSDFLTFRHTFSCLLYQHTAVSLNSQSSLHSPASHCQYCQTNTLPQLTSLSLCLLGLVGPTMPITQPARPGVIQHTKPAADTKRGKAKNEPVIVGLGLATSWPRPT